MSIGWSCACATRRALPPQAAVRLFLNEQVVQGMHYQVASVKRGARDAKRAFACSQRVARSDAVNRPTQAPGKVAHFNAPLFNDTYTPRARISTTTSLVSTHTGMCDHATGRGNNKTRRHGRGEERGGESPPPLLPFFHSCPHSGSLPAARSLSTSSSEASVFASGARHHSWSNGTSSSTMLSPSSMQPPTRPCSVASSSSLTSFTM